MEVLAAVSLAGNILQFIDFAGEVLTKCWKIYRSESSATEQNEEQEVITRDLKALSSRLQCLRSTDPSDPTMEKLCSQCNAVADELLAMLESFKTKGKRTTLQSLEKSLKSTWSKDKVIQLKKRLDEFRQELEVHVLFELKYVFTASMTRDLKS